MSYLRMRRTGLRGFPGTRSKENFHPVLIQRSEKQDEKDDRVIKDDTGEERAFPFPQKLKEIPGDYYAPAQEQGTLVELNYATWRFSGMYSEVLWSFRNREPFCPCFCKRVHSRKIHD